MDSQTIEILLGILSFLASTIVGLYLNSKYRERKEYSDFLKRLSSIVGLGGRIIYMDDTVYRLYQVEKIDRQGMVLKGYNKTIFIPISKLMSEDIIVPDINFEHTQKENDEEADAQEQELEEFRHKKISEIYAHTIKDIANKYIIPEIERIIEENRKSK